jgi:Mrp family chromosome partitioning ATPase
MLFAKNRKKKKVNQKSIIPDLVVPSGDGTPAFLYPGSIIESIRLMTTRIQHDANIPRRIAVVSALREEGVTFIAQVMATTFANDTNERICIVDLNWWWPSSSNLVAVDNLGLAGVVTGDTSLAEAIAPTGWSNLSLLPAGQLSPIHRPRVARGKPLRDIIMQLSKQFDRLILDIPAIKATTDAIPLASLADACCVVVRQGATGIEDVKLALDDIRHLLMLGVVLNRVNLKTPTLIQKYIPMQ